MSNSEMKKKFENWMQDSVADAVTVKDILEQERPINACWIGFQEGWKARKYEIYELDDEADQQHQTIMRQKVLLDQAHEIISQHAPGFTILLGEIETALYGKKEVDE